MEFSIGLRYTFFCLFFVFLLITITNYSSWFFCILTDFLLNVFNCAIDTSSHLMLGYIEAELMLEYIENEVRTSSSRCWSWEFLFPKLKLKVPFFEALIYEKKYFWAMNQYLFDKKWKKPNLLTLQNPNLTIFAKNRTARFIFQSILIKRNRRIQVKNLHWAIDISNRLQSKLWHWDLLKT